MKKKNEQFEKNIARLVKLTGDSQNPSEHFTDTLIESALRELPQAQPGRQKRVTLMKSQYIKFLAVAASIIIIAGVFLLYKTTTEHPVRELTVNTQKPKAFPAEPASLAASPEISLVPIPLTLPKPMFVGTPQNLEGVASLEKPLGRPRPPFLAPKGVSNVALNKPVTSSETLPIMGELPMIVDGDKEATEDSVVELGPFKQWVVIDLEQEYDIYAIVVWHYHKTPMVYYDIAVQVSTHPEFLNAVCLFNNDRDNSLGLGVGTDWHYVETAEGKLIDCKGVRSRYVRLWSQGNNQNDYNHYIEVEVYGKPTERQTDQNVTEKPEKSEKDLVPISLKLPKPMFVGTPQNLEGVAYLMPPMQATQAPMAHGGTTPPNGEPVDAMFFKNYGVNPFIDTDDDHLSTFAIDVDTASYTLCRNYLLNGNLPANDAVRVEEFVNYFDYNYPAPEEDTFAVFYEAMPWSFSPERQNTYLMRIGLKALQIPDQARKPAVLTFVIDVSGSMSREDRLGLVKQSLRLLIDKLRPDDKIGIAIYGSRGRAVLAHTSLAHRDAILEAIDALNPEGSTYAEEGIRIGYDMAQTAFTPGCINRVILCSDGVANVGQTGADQILKIIKEKADNGITLSALGFGMGNYNDVLMEQLGDKGNGYYAYIDTLDQARRLFSNLTGALQVVARDVKIQVDFNPDVVRSYRLIGYENRDVADQDFRNDTVDGGEIGAGHATTALYELKLWPEKVGQLATTFIRYKHPDTYEVTEISADFNASQIAQSRENITDSFALASMVTEFAEILRESYWAKGADLTAALARAEQYRQKYPQNSDAAELKDLIARAAGLLQAKKQQQLSDTPASNLIPADIEYQQQP